MAGHRNSSLTLCVFGLRGVRVALEDEAPDAINVRLTMCSDLPALRHHGTRAFLVKERVAESAADSGHDVREIQLRAERELRRALKTFQARCAHSRSTERPQQHRFDSRRDRSAGCADFDGQSL